MVYIYDPIEITVREYLMSVQSVPVHVNAPKVLPTKFIQVNAVGGSDGLVSQFPMVTFVCWDSSRAAAARFAEEVKAMMGGCQSLGGLPVYRLRTIGLPTYRPDPDTGHARFQFTLEIRVRGKQFAP